jgi:signal transduction histidine kinase/CheY-like chemotaxis protein
MISAGTRSLFPIDEAPASSTDAGIARASMDAIYLRGDRVIGYAIAAHAALAISFAPYANTWTLTIISTLLAAGAFFLSAWIWPGRFITRVTAGITLQAFCALYIYQFNGLAEMHFFFFSSVTLLIIYQDWVATWPGVILIVLQHIFFAVVQNQTGSHLHYFEVSHVGFVKLFWHFGIALLDVVFASYVAAVLRQRTLKDAAQRAELAYHRERETRLHKSQKMEAIGQLAGGVAHDFNNLLTVILGHTEFLLGRASQPESDREELVEIRRASERAAALTRQLLAFSRQQVLQPRILDLNAVISDVEPMLRRLIGEHIIVRTQFAGSLGAVRADVGQIEQVLLNLAVNARDAMPDGGTLTISTANIDIDERAARARPGIRPGVYAMVAVTDTGVGMEEATRERIFEPFFTTKGLGHGTGLGLATVYGIVKQSGGHIVVDSAPGAGATFKVFLPRVAGAKPPVERIIAAVANLPRGSETLLLVEDEDTVRYLSRRALEGLGYLVIEATNGAEGLQRARDYCDPIDLVVTDAIMPHVSGRAMVDQLLHDRGDVRVLFVSGYTDDDMLRQGMLRPGCAFLQKPYTPEVLARAVRKALDSPVPVS